MNKILTTSKIVYFYALVILTVISGTGFSFLYNKEKSKVDKIAQSFNELLIDNFNINERMSDSISVRYLRIVNSQEKAKKNYTYKYTKLHGTIYGENNADQSEPDKLLLSAVDYIWGRYKFNDEYKGRLHYFIPTNHNYIYTIKPLVAENYHFKKNDSTMVKLLNEYPDYIDRKFILDTTKKGQTSTGMYIDPITKRMTYSVVSYVYDLRNINSDHIMGVLMFDYDMKEYEKMLLDIDGEINNKYLSAKIVENYTNHSSFFFGDKDFTHHTKKTLSGRYSIIFSTGFIPFIIYNKAANYWFLISVICSLASILIIDSHLKKNKKENMTDHLTGLFNRKVINHIPVDENSMVFVMDCNKFKVINDTHGHDVGDYVLTHISHILKNNTRKQSDILVRLGGDEFCMVSQHITIKNAHDIMKKINSKLNEFFIDMNVSLSYGISRVSAKCTLHDAIKEADTMLYENKKSSDNFDLEVIYCDS